MASIKTGYYSKIKTYTENGYTPYSVSVSVPSFVCCDTIQSLVPPYDLLKRYKSGEITELQYRKEYFEILTIRQKQVLKDLINILTKTPNIVILCWERKGKFCHRHLIAEFLNERFGLNITEL